MKRSTVLITGVAGFIGSTLAKKLLSSHYTVIGIDNLYPAYNLEFKKDNILGLVDNNFVFYDTDIRNAGKLKTIFNRHKPQRVFHLAALTGVRASLQNPDLYADVNIAGTKNTYEYAYNFEVRSFIFSSSSSVYGNNKIVPFSENAPLSPRSPYAISKAKAEELLHKLYKQYNIPTLVCRFFSVYGPNGRPDMAPYLFTEAAFNGSTITQYGNGETARDYTYIDDITNALGLTLTTNFGFEIINLGNSKPIKLEELIATIEGFSKKKILRITSARISSESGITFADITKAKKLLGWTPKVSFASGIKQLITWYAKNRL